MDESEPDDEPAAATPAAAPPAAAPPAARPSAAPAGAISFPALIEAVSKEKITLGAALERGRGEPKPGGGYVIHFAKAFDLDMAKRAAPILEAALLSLAGRPVPLELALGASGAAPVSEIVDCGMPEPPKAADAPPGTHWKDVAGGEAPGSAAGLKNAEGVFGGKARVIKKNNP